MKTCAFCGWRDACKMGEFDSKAYPACLSCVPDAERVESIETDRDAIVAVLLELKQASTGDIAIRFGGKARGSESQRRRYHAIRQRLFHMRRRGFVESVSRRGQKSLYRLTGKPVTDGRSARYSSEQSGSVNREAA